MTRRIAVFRFSEARLRGCFYACGRGSIVCLARSCRTGVASYDGELRYVEDAIASGPLSFDNNDTLEPRVTRPVGDEEQVSKGA